MLKFVYFDLYGTLVDVVTDEASPATASCFASWMARRYGPAAGRAEPIFQRIRGMGAGLEEYQEPDFDPVVHQYLADVIGRSPRQEEVAACAAAFRECSRRRLALMPGAMECIGRLKDRFGLGLLSNAQALLTLPELEALDLAGRFAPMVLSSDVGYKKPSARIFDFALEEAGYPPDQVLHVGNDPFADVDGAVQCRIRTCRVRDPYFNGWYSQTAPDLFVEDLAELTMHLTGPDPPPWVTD